MALDIVPLPFFSLLEWRALAESYLLSCKPFESHCLFCSLLEGLACGAHKYKTRTWQLLLHFACRTAEQWVEVILWWKRFVRSSDPWLVSCYVFLVPILCYQWPCRDSSEVITLTLPLFYENLTSHSCGSMTSGFGKAEHSCFRYCKRAVTYNSYKTHSKIYISSL